MLTLVIQPREVPSMRLVVLCLGVYPALKVVTIEA
jgi:hypothetical protein